MALVQTKFCREPWEIDQRLVELGLTREGLRQVRSQARHAAGLANPFYPANAAGTFSYQYGVWSLRNEFVGDDWKIDRLGGVESIRNDKLKVRIAFCNVDLTCVDEHNPKPRSEKGAGAERVTQSFLFDNLPQYAAQQAGEWSFYYFMLDQDGKAELSRPVVKGGKFVSFVERVYLYDDGADPEKDLLLDDGDIADNFDPQVARKS